MKFTLMYEGPLRPSDKATKEHKHDIRKILNAQLQSLWELEPLRSYRSDAIGDAPVSPVAAYESARDEEELSTAESTVQCVAGGFYLPIVTEYLYLLAEVGITWFRQEPPGSLLNIGDIDNKLKTFLDCLQTPPLGQAVSLGEWNSNASPFYTVLQDDALISSIKVDTVRDLRPRPVGNADVLLLVEVRTVVTSAVWGNDIFQ